MESQFNPHTTDTTGAKPIKLNAIPIPLAHALAPDETETLAKEVLVPVQPQHEPLLAYGFDVASWGVHQAALLLGKNSDDIVAIPASARGHLGAAEAFDIIDVHEGKVDSPSADPVFLVQISVYRDQFNRNRLHIQEYEHPSKEGEKLAHALRETFDTHLATQEVIEKADAAAREHLQLPLGTLAPGEKKNNIMKKLYTLGALTTIGVTGWEMAQHVTNGNWFLGLLAGGVASIPFWISRYRSQQRHNVSALVEEISGASFKKREYDYSFREMFGDSESRNLKALKTVISIENDPSHLVALSRLVFVCALNRYPQDKCRALLKMAEKKVPTYGIEHDEIGTLIDALEKQPAFDSGALKQPYFDDREHLIRHIQKNAIRSQPVVYNEANHENCASSQVFDQLDNLTYTLAFGLGLLPSDVKMIVSPKGAYPWAKAAFEFCEVGERAAQISPDGKLPILQVLEFQTQEGDPKLLIKPFDHPCDAGLKVIRAAREVLDEYAIDASGSLQYLYRLPGKNRSFMGNRSFTGVLRKLSVIPYAGSVIAITADAVMIGLSLRNAAHMTPELSKQIAAQVGMLYPLSQCIDLPRTLWQSCAAISKRREIFDKGASLYSTDENKKDPDIPYVDGTDFKGLVYEAEHTSRTSRLLEIARIARAVSLFKLAHRKEGQWLSHSIRLCRRIELSFPHGSEQRRTVGQYITEMETLSSEAETNWYGYDYGFDDI